MSSLIVVARGARLAVLVGLLFLMGAAGPAHAQIYVDADAMGVNDGTSWADAYTDLQTAIDNATGSSELWIAAGIYKPDNEGDSFTITGAKDGIKLYGGFEGTETNRDQRAPREHRTILSGDLNGDDVDPDNDGIIEDADPNQDGIPENLKGGENAHHVLLVDGGSGIGATVTDDVTARTLIDGIAVTAGQADGSVFFDTLGGGLYCDGASNSFGCSPTLRRIVFAGNAADSGGAMFNDGRTGTASPSILNAVFVGNAAVNAGGAILNHLLGESGTVSPSLTNVILVANAAVNGGAIYSKGDPLTLPNKIDLSLKNVTLTANRAVLFGGALYSEDLEDQSPSTLTNTILWRNCASRAGDQIYNSGGFTLSLSHTLIEGGLSGINENVGSSTTDGSGNLAQDPQFVTPTAPAGTDGTFGTADDGINVADSSPALDAGTSDALPTDASDLDADGTTSERLPLDLTEAPRVQNRDEGTTGAVVNIGAYEAGFGGAPVATTAPPSRVDTDGATLAGSVTPNGAETTVSFAYREAGAASFTSVDAVESPITGTSDQSISASVDDLQPNTDYEVKVVASNSEGTKEGALKSFTTEAVGVAITGGGFGGLDRTFSATPGRAEQPVGVFRVTSGQSGAALAEASVTPDTPGVRGVDRAALWVSSDNQFDPLSNTELAALDLDPQTDLPSPMTFGGFTEHLPGQARYLFVTVTLTDDAAGEVTGYLARETALSLNGGQITEVNGNRQNDFSNLPLSGDASTLPVEMASFEGTTTQEGVQLRWQTASEQNNAGFHVERRISDASAPGVRRVGTRARESESAWTRIGFVEGTGTTSDAEGVRDYRLTDTDLPYAADTLTYRLRQVDADGSTALTDPVTVARGRPGGLELLGTAPNPARQRATVRYAISGDASSATLRLYDVLGRQVRSVQLATEAGRHKTRLDVRDLSSGVYVLRVQAGGEVRTQKMTVL
mgnify:CR=1 FL=1